MPNRSKDFFEIARARNYASDYVKSADKNEPSLHVDLFTQEATSIYWEIRRLQSIFHYDTLHDWNTSNNLAKKNTHNEYDDIEFQIKVRQCKDRIEMLEQVEKERKTRSLAAQKAGSLLKWLQVSAVDLSKEELSLHREGVTWLLNARLLGVSKQRKDQQEKQLLHEQERTKNQLFASVDYMPTDIQLDDLHTSEEPMQDLPPELLQVLESENSTLLDHLNDTLLQVNQTERTLLEISTLQSQLASHLAAQTQQTQSLYEDAILSTDRVEQGNLQLIKTRERNYGTRKFLLAFLIGASFVLLFLDWYS